MNHQSQLKKGQYRNWVKGCLAYKYLRDGVESFADELVHQEHTRILQTVQCSLGQDCSQCNLKTLKPKHERVKDPCKSKHFKCPWSQTACNCLANNKQSCPNNVCDEIFEEILRCHGSTPPTPNWKNTDLKNWCSNPWEIAKCFINAPGYQDKKKVSDIDVSGLLRVFINNKRLHCHLTCHINGNDVFYKSLRSRNDVFHSPSMELGESKMVTYIDDIIALLEGEKELKAKHEAQKAVENIKELKKNDVVITIRNEAEVFKEAMSSITKRTKELENLIQNAKLDIERKGAEESSNLDEKSRKALANSLQFLEGRYDQAMKILSDKVRHLEEVYIGIKTDISLMQKRLDEREKLDYARRQQQEQVNYITQKQDLQKYLIQMYLREHVKTWVSPLVTQQNNININEVYVSPSMSIEEANAYYSEGEHKKEHIECYRDLLYKFEDIEDGESDQIKPRDVARGWKMKNIYITGEIGAGKSAFCKMMIYTWCSAVAENFNSNIFAPTDRIKTVTLMK